MHRTLLTLLAALLSLASPAQAPATAFAEPADPADWESVGDGLQASWASRDRHYARSAVPRLLPRRDTVVYAWRGERVSMQAVLFSKAAHPGVEVGLEADDGTAIDHRLAQARLVGYVLCDEKRGCGDNPMTSPTYLVPDIIGERGEAMPIGARTTRPVWVTVEVPRDATPGERAMRLVARAPGQGGRLAELRLRLVVLDRALPAPGDYAFHTDFWQQPYAVARHCEAPRWSQRHFDLLRPYLRLLARGGQKVATAILFYEPWGAQSNDKFDAMVKTTKRKDGEWRYDYTVFDHYVELCDSCGIDGQINCYSMIPWDMSFRYYDEAEGRDVDLKAKTTDPAYRDLWVPFLKHFADHLKRKGWFEKTCIAMDEREPDDMRRAIAIVREAVPGMKIALAGNHHAELVDEIYDYSVHYGQTFTPDELAKRSREGLVTTAYTACNHLTPNLEAYNAPADAAYLPLYCLANGFTGYLHWSWMNWTDQPLRDSRFKLFPPGDTYVVYPGPRSSLRWERFVEGVQQAEKYRILREACDRGGDREALGRLEKALQAFRSGELNYHNTSAKLVNDFERLLNEPQK